MPQSPDPQLWVVVVRSGGFAGMVRRWRVDPAPERVDEWWALVRACPWSDAGSDARADAGPRAGAEAGRVDDETDAAAPRTASPPPPTGADRFSWEVAAGGGGETRRARLADAELAGPWRTLVDAVRAEGADTREAAPGTGSGAAAPEQ